MFARLTLTLAVVVSLVSCSSDTGENSMTACAVGESLNPITGACTPTGGGGPGPGPGPGTPGDDAGPGSGEGDVDVSEPDVPLTSDCSGNERRCNGNVVERCINGEFAVSQTCGDGLVCERGNCVPDDDGCTPGQSRCLAERQIQTCAADGETWTTELCGDGESCQGGVCTSGCSGLLSDKSNLGCEYITVRHDQVNGIGQVPHSVVVSNPGDQAVTVEVTSSTGTDVGIAPVLVQPLNSHAITFPTTPMASAAGYSMSYYLIRSSSPVIATQFAPLNNPGGGRETSDAHLLLPTNAIGEDYVVIGWPGAGTSGGSYVDIVGVEPNTTVTVQSPVALSGGSAGNVPAGGTATFTLLNRQLLHLVSGLTNNDVSGVRVTADKPIAVYSGAPLVNVPHGPIRTNPPAGCRSTGNSCTLNDQCCSGACGYEAFGAQVCMNNVPAGDHLENQMFPTESWGSSYLAAPFYNRGPNDFSVFRVTASEANTTVTITPPINGVSSMTLAAGEVQQLYTKDAFMMSADKPIMIAQFMVGGSIASSGDGDPAFLLPPAIEQFRDSYVFMTPANYAKNFVTLIKQTGSVVELDGSPVGQSLFIAIPGTIWEYAMISSIPAGVHRASSSQPFGIVVHGMDNYISYAFAGGVVLPD